MSSIRHIGVVAVALAAVSLSCGDPDRASDVAVAERAGTVTSPLAPSEHPASERPASERPASAPAAAPAQAAQLEQPAIWPAPDVVFATPEDAAADFVASVFGVDPALGEYRGGDQRSGEIDVLVDHEELTAPQVRSGLTVRKLAPTDGWFVLGARNESMAIDVPESAATVARGPLTVEGAARGFEGTVVVTAFAPGAAGQPLDQVIVRGGPFEEPEPYSAQLDLSAATPGTVVILVRGDTGLDGDTGEFSAIPVVVTDGLPASR